MSVLVSLWATLGCWEEANPTVPIITVSLLSEDILRGALKSAVNFHTFCGLISFWRDTHIFFE